MKRAIDKTSAIIIAAVLLFLQLALWTSLGSTNKSHAVLYLIALVSYNILRKQNKEEHKVVKDKTEKVYSNYNKPLVEHKIPDITEKSDNNDNNNLSLHKEAIEACKKAISIDPYNPDAYNNLGAAYAKLSFHQAAIEAYKQAISIDPNNAVTNYNLGITYNNLGLHQEAIEAYKQAIRINPNNALSHLDLGLTYSQIKDDNSAFNEYLILEKIDDHLAKRLWDFINYKNK